MAGFFERFRKSSEQAAVSKENAAVKKNHNDIVEDVIRFSEMNPVGVLFEEAEKMINGRVELQAERAIAVGDVESFMTNGNEAGEISREVLVEHMHEFLRQADKIASLAGESFLFEEAQKKEIGDNDLFINEDAHAFRSNGDGSYTPWGETVPAGYVDESHKNSKLIEGKGTPDAYYPNTYHVKKLSFNDAGERDAALKILVDAKKVAQYLAKFGEKDFFTADAYEKSSDIIKPATVRFRSCRFENGEMTDFQW